MTDSIDTQITSPPRLAALNASGLLEQSVEPALDRLTRLACAVLGVPVALISLVDKDRQFFKSHCGLPLPIAAIRETPLSHSFCQHVVTSGEPLLIRDARDNPIVSENLAIRDIGVIAYAGVPITDDNGFVLGSLCAIDIKPRDWPAEVVGILRTLSMQVSAEVTLRAQTFKLAEDLNRHQAMEADRRSMMRLNVHDLRTPLSAMLLGLETLGVVGELNDEQQEYFSLVKRNGDALLNIVNNLLDIGEIEQRGQAALRRSACHPAESIANAIDLVQVLANEKQIQLIAQPAHTLPALQADADKLLRVLVNLLGNAIKFTPAAGHVQVKASLTLDKSSVQFAVRDNGIGMTSTDRIFEEGVRLDDHSVTRQSTGLGLTFCKRIIEAHGGRIWAESQAGEGSTFYFVLPV